MTSPPYPKMVLGGQLGMQFPPNIEPLREAGTQFLTAAFRIEANLKGLDVIESRFDPGFRSNFLARAQLQLLVVLLNAWQTEDYGVVLDRFLALKAA